ncbi:hypothetical protein BAT_3595 [Bacillus pumilus ATCC 7061]|nr:hypothetical protein BAT_3595 [Bacillus pumilus ATCC 7061]
MLDHQFMIKYSKFYKAKGFPSSLSNWKLSIYTYRHHEQSHLLDL